MITVAEAMTKFVSLYFLYLGSCDSDNYDNYLGCCLCGGTAIA